MVYQPRYTRPSISPEVGVPTGVELAVSCPQQVEFSL